MRSLYHYPSKLLAVVVCLHITLVAQSSAEPDSGVTSEKRKDSAPKVRLVFLSSLVQDDELVLASPGKDGKWKEYGELTARDSFITRWFEVRAGELHLTRRTPEGLASRGRLVIPPRASSVLAVVVADPEGDGYLSKVIDPAKRGFARGSTLLMNFSKKKAMVVLGKTRVAVRPGDMEVSKAAPDANGMYRMLAGYKNPDDKLVVCYDRYVSSNPKSREFLFLLPDENLGLRVLSLPEFGGVD